MWSLLSIVKLLSYSIHLHILVQIQWSNLLHRLEPEGFDILTWYLSSIVILFHFWVVGSTCVFWLLITV